MGLFSSKKKTYVSSVIYNMAGDIADRPSYLKSVVAGNIITSSNYDLTTSLSSAYLNGPGMRMRKYYRWAAKHYGIIGIPEDSIRGDKEFDASLVSLEIRDLYKFETAYTVWIEAQVADITYWGLQYMYEHLPLQVDDDWEVDFDDVTLEATITFEDATPQVVFKPNGYIKNKMCLYASYMYTQNGVAKGPRLLIYPYGSGSPVLDAQMLGAATAGRYLPFIPVRHNNNMLSESYLPDVYAAAKKAYKHALNDDLDDLIEKIGDNESIADIDFAYVAFGVSLNTKEQAAKKYLFRFIDHCRSNQILANSEYVAWVDSLTDYDTQLALWQAWYDGGQLSEEPFKPTLSSAPTNSIRIRDTGSVSTGFDMEVTWGSITEVTGSGLGKVDARVGEVWIDTVAGLSVEAKSVIYTLTTDVEYNAGTRFWKQVTADSWVRLDVIGLTHKNNIYNGKFVETTAKEALDDGEESGFLIPLNYDILKDMSLVDSTQLSTASTYLVFNCYKVVKQKWYQTGWFKILLIVAIIVITVMYPPAGTVAGGILGSSAAVGVALGFSGLAALIAGTIANMIAAMILTKILASVSVAIFGEKLGLIIAAVATFVTIGVTNGLQQGMSMTQALSSLMDATSLIQMTNSIGGGIAGVMAAKAQETAQKTQDLLTDYNKESGRISDAYADEFGYGTFAFDPMALTNYTFESSESFLSRTLMTGSDIATLTNELLTNFTSLTLSLDLP